MSERMEFTVYGTKEKGFVLAEEVVAVVPIPKGDGFRARVRIDLKSRNCILAEAPVEWPSEPAGVGG
jgi:hypothetical protein